MTSEEVISVLNDYDINFERNTPEEVAEAHEMAIKALEEQSSEDWNAVLDELIRIGRNAFKDDTDYDNLFDFISNLPNVKSQPSERTEERTETHACDCVSRQAAINALWKALHEYEDKTEKQFLESKELDVADWFQHRIFVQNMNDIDRQTILNLPSVVPQPNIEQIIKSTIKEYLDKDYDDVTELLLSLNKDLCERIRRGE